MAEIMVELTGPAYRSYSSFTGFLRCGKAWQLSRIVKVEETPALYLAGGSAVHKVTEILDRAVYGEAGG